MSASGASAVKSPRRRWPKILGAIAVILIVGIIVIAHYLQPARLTALILDRASRAMKLELRTSGPGSYALRPEPRLVLPGFSATVPGENAPFFRSGQVELALPWSTLRGRGTDISSIVLKSPDIDLPALQRWSATQPPSTTPFKFPRLTSGLQIHDGVLRAGNWRIEHFNVALPTLADGKPTALDVSGTLQRGSVASKFALTMTSTPAGIGRGLRIDNARIALKSDGELPSLTATGSILASDSYALDLSGTMQRVPPLWAASIDTSFAQSTATPFAIKFNSGIAFDSSAPASAPAGAAPMLIPSAQQLRSEITLNLQTHTTIGDARRQPALSLDGEAHINGELQASLRGQLSRWPNAWPALPPDLGTNAVAIVFDASYQGPRKLTAPIAFNATRADTSLQGRLRIADVNAWIKRKFDTPLPPIEAALRTPQLEVGGMQLRGVQMEIRDDVVPSQPVLSQPAPKPAVAAPKS